MTVSFFPDTEFTILFLWTLLFLMLVVNCIVVPYMLRVISFAPFKIFDLDLSKCASLVLILLGICWDSQGWGLMFFIKIYFWLLFFQIFVCPFVPLLCFWHSHFMEMDMLSAPKVSKNVDFSSFFFLPLPFKLDHLHWSTFKFTDSFAISHLLRSHLPEFLFSFIVL